MVHTTAFIPGSVAWGESVSISPGMVCLAIAVCYPAPPPLPPFIHLGGKGHCEIKVSCPRTQRSDLAGLRFELVRFDQDSSALTMGNRVSHLHTHHQTCSQFLPKFNEKWCQSLRLLEITRRLVLSNAPQNFKRLCEDSGNLLRIFQKTLGVLTI